MKLGPGTILLLVLVGGLVLFGLGRCTASHEVVMGPIVTVHDTIPGLTKFDTAWVDKVRKVIVHDTINKLIRETVVRVDSVRDSIFIHDTLPQTYYVADLLAGQKMGDSTRILTVRGDGQRGISTFFTTGPILAIQAGREPAPRIQFGEFPRKRHGILTDILIVGVAGTAGFAACEVVNGITGR